MTLKELTRDYRALRPHGFTWPGGYQALALTSDGGCLCWECLEAEKRDIWQATSQSLNTGWELEAFFVHWEGEPEHCSNCNKELPSEYGPTE